MYPSISHLTLFEKGPAPLRCVPYIASLQELKAILASLKLKAHNGERFALTPTPYTSTSFH